MELIIFLLILVILIFAIKMIIKILSFIFKWTIVIISVVLIFLVGFTVFCLVAWWILSIIWHSIF